MRNYVKGEETVMNVTIKKCPECGAELEEEALFCGECGCKFTACEPEPIPEPENSTIICPSCGAENQRGKKFCIKCGNDLPQEEEKRESICPECGAELEEGALFCGECGHKFANSDVSKSNKLKKAYSEAAKKVREAAEKARQSVSQPDGNYREENEAEVVSKSKAVPVIITALIAVILIAALCLLAMSFMDSSGTAGASGEINMFSEGLLAVEDSSGRWGYINKKGEYVITPQFSEAYPFDSDGTAVVFVGNKLAIIDKTGKFIVQPKLEVEYTYFEGFADNGLAVVDDCKYIDKKGNIVIELDSGFGGSFAKNGLALVGLNVNGEQKYGYIDKTGSFVIEPQFSKAYGFNDEGLALVYSETKGQYGFIDKNGEYKITVPYGYEALDSEFSDNGWLTVCSENKCGLMDKKGNVFIKPQFDSVKVISNGWALVLKSDAEEYDGYREVHTEYGFVTPNGEIIEPQFEDAGYSVSFDGSYIGYCLSDNGLQPVCKDGKWGYIDETGEFVIEPQFDSAGVFYDGYAKITIGESGGIINSKGEYDSLPYLGYSMLNFVGDMSCAAYTDTEWVCVDNSGKEVISINFDVDNYKMLVNGKETDLLPTDDVIPVFYMDDGYTFLETYNASKVQEMIEAEEYSYEPEKSFAIIDSEGNITASGFKDINTEISFISVLQDNLYGTL